ncbi:MAG TPA: DUF1828 domain-containing protein [Candidatus Binataceae bacterium]|nr:DUF1828 domain-containing protein [Candidatus Binataceae bacterium]
MPETNDIERDFKRKVCDQVSISSQGDQRYVVDLPMTFEDGDKLSVILKKEADEGWILTDEGHTFMQLTYDLDESDLQEGTRREVIDRTILASRLRNRQGELILPIPNERFGDSLYTFVQALIKIDDVRYLSRERVKSTFAEDFRRFLDRATQASRRSYKWHDPVKDPKANYEADYRLNGTNVPLFIFALDSDVKVRDATITLGQYERWGWEFKSLGVFEDQESINRKVLARFLDICGKSFSDLSATEERFAKTFPEYVSESKA